MISEIFLHVGFHKTATSSIQNTLFSKKNSKFLEDNDYFYPKHWLPNHSTLYSVFSDHPEKWHLNIKKGYSIEEIKKVNETYLHSIEEEIELQKTCSKLIISGEEISFMTMNNLLNLRNYFLSTCGKQVKFNIVIFVRNPISLTVSVIQQLVKSGHNEQIALKIGMRGSSHLFQERIERFTKAFGSESVKVYSFDEAIKHKFGPVGYFLALLNLNNDEISRFHYKRTNEGLSMFAVKFLSYVNMKMPLIIDEKLHKNRTLVDIIPLSNVHGPKYDISHTDKKAIIENSQHDVNWLRKNYGIDYSFPSFSKNQNDFEITEEIIHDLKNIFQNLSHPLKRLLIEFLQLYCDSVNDEKNKIYILNLIHEFKEYKKPKLPSKEYKKPKLPSKEYKKLQSLSKKSLLIGFKILSKILPNSVTDKIRVFYMNKISRAR